MSNYWVVRGLSAMLALFLSIAGAAASAEEERLRVGLVLGGGGARGAAHIGVLQELERLRIPIDAIAGTSMGAIVGGLYASGTSSDELQQIVQTLDWTKALSDTPPRRDLSLRRKKDDERFPIELELGVRDGALVLCMPIAPRWGKGTDRAQRGATKLNTNNEMRMSLFFRSGMLHSFPSRSLPLGATDSPSNRHIFAAE